MEYACTLKEDMKRITQKKTAFYILWKAHKANPEEYLPAWKFVGEIHIEELGKWAFMSYKGPTNGLVIYFDNPGLVERQMTTGKTGARYYEYRLAPHSGLAMIRDTELREFAESLESQRIKEIWEEAINTPGL
jgi:hypothetical protein